MNNISIYTLKVLRKLYAKTFGSYKLPVLQREEDPNKASEKIFDLLSSDKPCMIARFGSTEMLALVNYLGVNSKKHSVLNYIKGKQPEWWWNKNVMNQMQQWSGFFPPTPENMQHFGTMMINDIKYVDILGSWLSQEALFTKDLSKTIFIDLELLNPFWAQKPWSRVLHGKKILVVHPFAETIKSQYKRREKLFKNNNILPEFELFTLKAVQSLGGVSNQFRSWFDALDWMKNEMDKVDYDICLIGCGAYGFPLAAHAKRMGKKAVHLGGSLQLLFGIKGKRWENPNYNNKYNYSALMNNFWIIPDVNDRSKNAINVEGGCYW